MTACKMIQFTRLQVTNENIRNGKKTNLKELPKPYKLSQGALTKSVKVTVKIGKTFLPPVSSPCIHKVLKEG